MQKVPYILLRLLGDIKMTHESIELNLLLTEYKESPDKIHNVLKKMRTPKIIQSIS